jgi:hypothetical protein
MANAQTRRVSLELYTEFGHIPLLGEHTNV